MLTHDPRLPGRGYLMDLAGRVLLTAMFWTSGFDKAVNYAGAVAQMQRSGLHPPELFAIGTILVQLLASAAVILRRYDGWGALALAVFTALTVPISHAWWRLEGPARSSELHLALEHLAVIGALVMVMVISQWRSGTSSPVVVQTR